MRAERWAIRETDPQAEAVLRAAGRPALLAAVLAARGVRGPEEADRILARDDDLRFPPLLLRDMDRAVERIRRAVRDRETVAVFGDYDVDGITSTVLLCDYLRGEGVPCLRHIPRRIEDGYGLSKGAVRALHDQGASLIVTVDCGITGCGEVAYAASLGVDVVVTDHHECKDALPEAVAVVDPHRPDCPFPFKHLAGCGVALELVLALGGEDRREELFERYCPLAAIGTVADVMRMEGENRTIVSRGLELLPRTPFIGLHALLKEVGLWGRPVTSIQIGFVLSPRINAAGRMGQADLAADLLETRDPARAEELARALCELNRRRQAVEQEIAADVSAQIQAIPPDQRRVLVLSSREWHQGVVGIVASRVSERWACPTFLIQVKDGVGKGSCRSYGGLDLFAALESCADLLEGFGGHELAAGFTIREEDIGAFRTRMDQYVRSAAGPSPPVATLDVDVVLSPGDATLEQEEALRALEPYGAGNARPVFALLGATVDLVQSVGQGRHLKLRLSKGPYRFDAIFFSVTEAACGVGAGDRVDAAFYLQANTFRGVTALQFQIIDLRPSLTPSRHEAEALGLVRRLRDGGIVSAQEVLRLGASRAQFAACWKALEPSLRQGPVEVPALPWLRALAARMGGCETFLRSVLAVEVFRERGLIDLARRGDDVEASLRPREGKVDLAACPYLRRLRDSGGPGVPPDRDSGPP